MPVKISPEAFVKKDYRNSNLAYKKKCVECGCVYYAKHDRSLYCSRQCNNLYSKRKKKGAMAQGGIATKALTTGDEKTGIKLITEVERLRAEVKALSSNLSIQKNGQTETEKASAEELFNEYGQMTDYGKKVALDLIAMRNKPSSIDGFF